MNQQRYRQAVRSIHWSAQQRAEIEAKLQTALQPSADPEEWIDGMEDPMATFRQSYESMRKAVEYEMKSKKMRKVMWIGLAAALLATGGAIAGVAAYAKKHPRTLEIIWKNGTTLNLTSEEHTAPYVLGRYPNAPGGYLEDLTPTESGWFYRKNVAKPNNSMLPNIGSQASILSYVDKATGQNVPVCAKPNCLHDGSSEYCTATSMAYACSYMQYYNGYLYSVTTKYLDLDSRNNHNELEGPTTSAENCRQVLLRYSPDGTEITELADFGKGIGVASCTINRGYVWCLVQLQQEGEEFEHPITHRLSKFQSGGWQIWGYELATGKSVLVYDAMGDPEINHVNKVPNDIYAYGDYLYFQRQPDDWSGGNGFLRISLLTGEITESDADVIIQGSHFVCLSATHAISFRETKYKGQYAQEYDIIDLATLEKKTITRDFDSAPENEILLGRDSTIRFMNDKYIFALNHGDNISNKETMTSAISIYDYDGNLVKSVDTGYRNESIWKTTQNQDGTYNNTHYNEGFTLKAIDGDTIYAEYVVSGDDDTLKERGKEPVRDIMYTTVDELLSGTSNWQKAYSTLEEASNDAE